MAGAVSFLFPFRADSDKIQNLVWSGAHLVTGDRATFDFKVSQIHGTDHLIMLLLPYKHSDFHPSGAGLILDSSLNVSGAIYSQRAYGIGNMHEFNVIADGKRALMITHQSYYRPYSMGRDLWAKGHFVRSEIRGLWKSISRQGLSTLSGGLSIILIPLKVCKSFPKMLKATGTGCRYMDKNATTLRLILKCRHINSVDKDEEGDFLISARFCNTIYKISGKDGSIIWRLGGPRSSFAPQDFNFTGQHDARFREACAFDTVITFLNNAAVDNSPASSNHSAGLIVALDEVAMTANLVKVFPRPDGQLSRLRGNMQVLPNSDILINWSDNGFMSEFTHDGQHVLDVQFGSHRFTTY